MKLMLCYVFNPFSNLYNYRRSHGSICHARLANCPIAQRIIVTRYAFLY